MLGTPLTGATLIKQRYRIEQMRRQLEKLVTKHGSLTAPVVLAYSRMIDGALNEFERMRRAG